MVDGEKAVIGGDEDIGGLVQPLFLQRGQQVRPAWCRHRACRPCPLGPLMPGTILADAVLGIVLAVIGIARPEQQRKGFAVLRRNAAARCASWPSSARLPARCWAHWSAGGGSGDECLSAYWRVNQAGRPKPPSRPVVSSSKSVWLPSGVAVESWMREGPPCRSGGLQALGAGGVRSACLIQIIAAEFLVHLVQHRVVFQKAHDGRAIQR